MASVTRRDTSAGPRYDVRWRLVDGTHRKRSFKRRAEAERYRRKIEGDEVAGVVIDPNSGEIRFGPYAEQWIRTRLVKGQPLSPSTVQVYRGLLRRHLARFSDAPLRKLTPEVVRDWHSDLVESAGRDQAAKSYRLLRAVLNTAVEDLRIGRNPCQIRGAGIERAAERPIVEAATILDLAAAINPRLRALIVLSGFGGLRTGELLALTRRDVDLVHKTVQVRASAAEINGSGRVLGPPKSEAGVRVIALPSLAVKALDDAPQHLRRPRAGRGSVHRTERRPDQQRGAVVRLERCGGHGAQRADGLAHPRSPPRGRHDDGAHARCHHEGTHGPDRTRLASSRSHLPARHNRTGPADRGLPRRPHRGGRGSGR